MKTPAQYQHQVSEINLDGIQLEGLSAADAKALLARLDDAHARLMEIERTLALELRAFNAQYQGRLTAARTTAASRHGKNRGEEEQRIEDERDSRLAPYEEIKKELQERIARVDEMRARLQDSKAAPAKA